jgi:estrogen-related receptor beta like 1
MKIVQWLMVLIDMKSDEKKEQETIFEVQEYDDPNLSAQKLLQSLHRLNFTSDYPILRIKQPFGEAACNILDFLTHKAIEMSEIKNDNGYYWKHLNQQQGQDEQQQMLENKDEDEDDILAGGNDDDGDDDVLGISGSEDEDDKSRNKESVNKYCPVMQNHNKSSSSQHSSQEMKRFKENQSPAALLWRQELERVGPLLDMASTLDRTKQKQKNWRLLLQEFMICGEQLLNEANASELALERLCKDTTCAVNDIDSSEKQLNTEFHHIANEYDDISKHVSNLQNKCENNYFELEEARKELDVTSKNLANIKSKVDEKSNSITDTSQLVKIKTVLNGIKTEIRSYDAQIGMLEHTLLHKKLQLRKELRL